MTTDVSTQPIPDDYATAVEYIAPGITAIYDQTYASGTTWTDTFRVMLPNVQITAQQLALLNLELSRADAGLPAQAVSPTGGLSPLGNLSGSTIALIALGAYMLLGKK